MLWSEADREKYDVIRARCSSDMSEPEFALIAPPPPPPSSHAQPRRTVRVRLEKRSSGRGPRGLALAPALRRPPAGVSALRPALSRPLDRVAALAMTSSVWNVSDRTSGRRPPRRRDAAAPGGEVVR
jgi:hypothetical protein